MPQQEWELIVQSPAVQWRCFRAFPAVLLPWATAACVILASLAPAHAAPIAAALPPSAAASAASPAEVFRRMSADSWLSRVITLAELGPGGGAGAGVSRDHA